MTEHTAENDALTERAEAALDAYFLERIEHDEPPEPSSFGRVIPPERTTPACICEGHTHRPRDPYGPPGCGAMIVPGTAWCPCHFSPEEIDRSTP